MGFFSKKKKTQNIDVNNEIHRISKLMFECKGDVENIQKEKIFISEMDHNLILKGITKVILEVIEDQEHNLNQNDSIQIIVRGQNLANRVMKKLYDVDWIY